VFHSAAVLCGGSTGSLLATLIGSTCAEISPDWVLIPSENAPCADADGTVLCDLTGGDGLARVLRVADGLVAAAVGGNSGA
jgi:hypothetical protein